MAAPMHTYGQSVVTAVQLTPVYPSDSLYPSDIAYPDTAYVAVSPLGATLAAVAVNTAAVVAVINDAHLAATSFGGAALTPATAQIQLT